MKPLAVELFAGMFGWGEGLISAGWRVIGFDILHEPYHGKVPEGCSLVLQDVCTTHGAQFAGADLIVASPPCQEFSSRAMPWKRSRARHPKDVGVPVPAWWSKSQEQMDACERNAWERWREEFPNQLPLIGLNLFWQCWRIQQEACEAAGRYIPMVVENVKGAQKWVGRAKGRYGSFFLWGDVESIGGRLVRSGPVEFGMESVAALRKMKMGRAPVAANGVTRRLTNPNEWQDGDTHKYGSKNSGGTGHGQGSLFKIADSKERGLKLPGNNAPRMWSDRKVQRLCDAPTKNSGGSWFAQAHNTESGLGQNPVNGTKGFATGLGRGHDWRQDPSGRFNSKSSARKAASAQIAKIPLPLATWVGRAFHP